MFHEYSESGPFLLGNTVHKLGARFRLAPSNVVVANTIRRQVMSAVKTVGFRTEPAESSEVVIETNTTPLVNEMLAHRIGMIPIRADPATFDPARFEFRIAKENADKSMVSVSAADFQVIERDPANPLDEGTVLPTESFFPPDPITGETALITRLRPQWNPIASNEKLVLRARAAVSSGAENSRWCPVSQCSYEYTRDENPERIDAMFQNWVVVSKKINNVAELGEDRLDELRREYNTMEIQRCFRVDERGEPNDFTFYVESVGVLPVPEIIAQAIQATVDLLSKYQDLDGDIPEGVQIQPANTRFPAIDLIFTNENHTLGNLLQHYLVANHIDGTEEPKITFAGYKVPHPLKKEMVLCVGIDETDTEVSMQTARFVVAKVVRHCKEIFKGLLADWKRSLGQPEELEQPEAPSMTIEAEEKPVQ